MRPEILTEIEHKTRQQLQTFLDELANGTSNYRSLHSLTSQIEHQYHGRFVVEILQNAHDALRLIGMWGRIEFRLVADEGEYGTLYAANDGRSFTQKDFSALAALGQSDKDPNKCAGNKGIGFRSVLEISESPEIYSCFFEERGSFEGYCFRFDANSPADLLLNTLSQLLVGSENETATRPDWTRERFERFRALWGNEGGRKVFDEVTYLSPYLLPLPITTVPPLVREYGEKKFASLVRLPLKSEIAQRLAIEQLRGLTCGDVLFLEQLSDLKIHVPGHDLEIGRTITDHTIRESFRSEDVTLTVCGGRSESRQYRVWSRTIGGDSDPKGRELLATTVTSLPGRWPELQEVTVSAAVRIGSIPEPGRYSILLPTRLDTGTCAHVNAPFYGDISRTGIAFSEDLNQVLIKEVAHLVIDVLQRSVLRERSWSAGATVVDLLAPLGTSEGQTPDIFDAVAAICKTDGQNLAHLRLFFTDKGWKTASETKILPRLESPSLLLEDRLRAAATFSVVVPELESRERTVERLISRLGGNSNPNSKEMAATIEVAAQAYLMEPSDKNWNGFWRDTMALLPSQVHRPHPLSGQNVILGSDGRLHASDPKNRLESCACEGPGAGASLNRDFKMEIPVEQTDAGG